MHFQPLVASHTGEYLDLLERQMSELQREIAAYSSTEQSEFEKNAALRKKRMIHEMEMADRQQEIENEQLILEKKQQERLEKKRRKALESMSRKQKNIKDRDDQERQALENRIRSRESAQRQKDENERLKIENQNLAESEKDTLLRELAENQAKQRADFEKQAQKSRNDLEKRLADRRAKAKEIEKDIENTKIAIKEEKITKIEKADSKIKKEDAENQNQTVSVNHGEIILKSGILQELETIEKALEKTVSKLEIPKNPTNPPAFLAEGENRNNFEHRIIPETHLRAKELISLRYFEKVLTTLKNSFLIKTDFNIFVTNRLPEDGETFMPRFYNAKQNIVLLQKDHLTDIGLISTIAAHFISHVAADSNNDDRNVLILSFEI